MTASPEARESGQAVATSPPSFTAPTTPAASIPAAGGFSVERRHPGRRPWPSWMLAMAVQMRMEGKMNREITAVIGKSPWAIDMMFLRLREQGVEIPHSQQNGRPKKPLDLAEIRRMRAAGVTLRAIAQQLDVSVVTICRRLKRDAAA